MEWTHCISASPQIMHGTPCLTGTRIPVSVVLDNLADGATAEAILAQYPSLTAEHVAAALAYAAALARDRVLPIPV